MKDFVGKLVRQKRPRGKNGECRDTAKVTIVKNGVKRVYSLGRWDSPEAERAYNTLMAQYYSDTLEINSDTRLISDYLRTYLASAKVLALPGPRKTFIKRAVSWFHELFGSKRCSELSFNMITVFRDRIIHEAKKNNWTNHYANKLFFMMKRILIDGVIQGWFDSSLLPVIKAYPSIKERLKPSCTRTAVDDIIIQATLKYVQQPYADMIRLIRSACLRPSELIRMRKSNIIIKDDCWVVRVKSKTEHHGYPRIIVFDTEEQRILQKWIREDDDVLFRTKNNTPCSYIALKEALESALKRAKKAGEEIPHWTLYQLRHTAFTENVKKYGVEVASKLAGHANFDMARMYDHSTEDILISLAQKRSNSSQVD